MIAVVCHDAGGAEVISSWLLKSGAPYCLALAGPAKNIFQRKTGVSETVSLVEAIKIGDWVLCGTSWQSDLEKRAVIGAKKNGKKVVVFLDHWSYFNERFVLEGVATYPDEIWVGDGIALELAQRLFPGVNVSMVSNPYLEDMRHDLESLTPSTARSDFGSILYVCEPVREHALNTYGDERYFGYTEEDAVRYFVHNATALGFEIKSIKIRPHPSEAKDKYNWVLQTTSLPIEIGGDKTLLEEIAAADMVVGCESMAMVVGLLAKRRVICTIPPGGKACSLPHPEIEKLQVLLAESGVRHD